MGRYFTGDIEGKFWFGLQSSTAADRFGVIYNEPNYVEYYYDQKDLENVETEITSIGDALGDKLKVITDFFEKNNGYNDKMLSEAGISTKELNEYADLVLGIKIRDCIIENGSCAFKAEL